MNNINQTPEETKQDGHPQESEQTPTQLNPEELLAEVTQIVNRLFDPKNLINNAYLVKYSKGTNFEIPVEFIYNEYSIREKTQNKEIIDQALQNAPNVSVVIRGERIDSVKPKVEQTRSRITVYGIEEGQREELQKFVNQFLTNPDDILSWSFNNQLTLTILNCKDEDIASDLYKHLTTNSFKVNSDFLNLYISALENIKKRKKAKNYQQSRPNNNFYMNPYQMQAFYQMQMSYMNMYGNQNYYRPQNMGGPMNMQPNSNMGTSPEGKYHNNGYQKKPFNSKRGGFNKHRNKNFGNRRDNSNVNVPINDNDFPPLNNEEGNNEE